MTDPDVADKTYVEPITLDVLEKILKKERPDAILPTMGGQTALNLAMEAEKKGILKKYKIELIGANSKAISNAEDRKKFRKNMIEIGLDLPKSEIVNNNNQATRVLKKNWFACNHKTRFHTWWAWWRNSKNKEGIS